MFCAGSSVLNCRTGMANVGRPKGLLVLSDDDREQLTRWVRFVADRVEDVIVVTLEPTRKNATNSSPRSTRSPRRSRPAHRLRQLRRPQNTAGEELAGGPSEIPRSLSPDRLQLAEPSGPWFAYLTGRLLQRSVHKNIQTLERDIRAWAKNWNEHPKPFIWTKTADQILESIARLMNRTTGAGH